jgi:hypothetical protein
MVVVIRKGTNLLGEAIPRSYSLSHHVRLRDAALPFLSHKLSQQRLLA